MVVLLACETLLLVLLVVLVVGLLRSHAEILSRLESAEGSGSAEPGGGVEIPPPPRGSGVREAHDLVGTTVAGDAVKLGLGPEAPPTLLAFLSSGCSTCERFWGDLRRGDTPRELPRGVRIMAVTKNPGEESPSRLATLAGDSVAFVMSSAAWRDYGAPGAPYFIYVEGGEVHGEGSASSWQQISALLRDAIADRGFASGGERRTREVDRVLAASGIGPDDPSLYPRR